METAGNGEAFKVLEALLLDLREADAQLDEAGVGPEHRARLMLVANRVESFLSHVRLNGRVLPQSGLSGLTPADIDAIADAIGDRLAMSGRAAGGGHRGGGSNGRSHSRSRSLRRLLTVDVVLCWIVIAIIITVLVAWAS